MKKNLIIFLFFVIALISSSCDEGNDILIEPNAKLIWKGDFDNGGCGFFIQMDTTLYKPINEAILSYKFRIEEPLECTIYYIDLMYEEEYKCAEDSVAEKYKVIKLTYLDPNKEFRR